MTVPEVVTMLRGVHTELLAVEINCLNAIRGVETTSCPNKDEIIGEATLCLRHIQDADFRLSRTLESLGYAY